MLMSGKQLSLDSRIDLVQRLVTDKDDSNPQIAECSEGVTTPSDIEEVSEGTIHNFKSNGFVTLLSHWCVISTFDFKS